ncbi:unnamed protein product [Oncorhynchus mykiss]|uniref:Uncharacterized protein n=1 Tax=Oncorhynchus mykiss TaxID=8022 RepID=A0A060Y0I5_ONCMY|nr:unnamed protein product [Oncorhynchus mykiss]
MPFLTVPRSLHQVLLLCNINKMKNFKRRFSLSVPRTETIEENEFTEQINQLNIQHTQALTPDSLTLPSLHPEASPSPVSPEPATPGAQSPSQLQYRSKAPHRHFSMVDVSKRMSLPMDIRLPPEILKKLQMQREMESENNSPPCKPLSRMSRRASLSDIGFGKLETYVKLGKLGEVRMSLWLRVFSCSLRHTSSCFNRCRTQRN